MVKNIAMTQPTSGKVHLNANARAKKPPQKKAPTAQPPNKQSSITLPNLTQRFEPQRKHGLSTQTQGLNFQHNNTHHAPATLSFI
jgi:hypothetical protein